MTIPQVSTVRAYWKCPDCLSVYVTDVPKPQAGAPGWLRPSNIAYLLPFRPFCAACGAETREMGVVGPSGAVTLTHTDTVCDWSCQGALGPTCDCKCGGANHGDTWARKVVVVETRGTQPVVSLPDKAGEALAKAEEYRGLAAEATQAWQAKYGTLIERKQTGQWLDAGQFARYLEGTHRANAIRNAKALRTHKVRNAKLRALVAELRGEAG